MPYLPETLASLAHQTYQSFEVLAWDNGSTDGTVEELQRWIPSRLPGRVISDRPCEFLGDSRRELLAAAETELCAWIDADDVAEPTRLEKQVTYLRQHSETSLVGTQILLIDEQGAPAGPCTLYPVGHADLVNLLLANSPVAQPSVLFRRSALLAAGSYTNVGPVNVEDYDLWLRLAVHFQLATLPEPLLRYRVHPRSTTVLMQQQDRLRAAADACFIRHGPALFGLTSAEAAALRQGQVSFALPLLWRICRHLAHSQPVRVAPLARLRSPTFLGASHQLIRKDDLRTRLVLALVHPEWRVTVWQLGAVLETFLRRSGWRRLADWLLRLRPGDRNSARREPAN